MAKNKQSSGTGASTPVKQHVKLDNETVRLAEHYTRMVAMGDILGMTIIGPAGMGKTQLIEATLSEMGVEYVKYGGHITVASIYEYLFENWDKLIFFDDCSNIITNTEIMELLKQALSESQMKRTLHYRSHGVKLGATPKNFEFEGRIIMSFNAMDKNNPNVKAVLSRAPQVELKFSFADTVKAMKDIAEKGTGGDLLQSEKIIVTNEIKKYILPEMEVNLRQQAQAFKIYASCKRLYGNPPPIDKWLPLVKMLFGKKRESWIRELVRELAGDGTITRKELARQIAIKRQMSPRNAQRKIAEWLEAEEVFCNKVRDGAISIKPFK